MRNTKIETFTDTWNPVQGCKNGCRYCYAAGTARRFAGHRDLAYYMCREGPAETGELHVLDEPMRDVVTKEAEGYPFGFDPTFCRYRLRSPSATARPGNVFVCGMGDLFGPWVPDRWIEEVMEAAAEAPRHNYCFLTKFPERYNSLPPPPQNFLFGASVDTQGRLLGTLGARVPSLRFLSVEPLLERVDLGLFFREAVKKPEWVIVGPETGNASGRAVMKREWAEEIQEACREHGIPLYMKDASKAKPGVPRMSELMGEQFTQQLHPRLLSNIRQAPGAHGKTEVSP